MDRNKIFLILEKYYMYNQNSISHTDLMNYDIRIIIVIINGDHLLSISGISGTFYVSYNFTHHYNSVR